jgi:hypothetical protein
MLQVCDEFSTITYELSQVSSELLQISYGLTTIGRFTSSAFYKMQTDNDNDNDNYTKYVLDDCIKAIRFVQIGDGIYKELD